MIYLHENAIGTWLYGYNGCNNVNLYGSGAKGKIGGAYYDAWVMSNTAEVASNIYSNNAAALEFLGASGLNKDKQPQISNLRFKQSSQTQPLLSTVTKTFSSIISRSGAMIHTTAVRTGQIKIHASLSKWFTLPYSSLLCSCVSARQIPAIHQNQHHWHIRGILIKMTLATQ